jgi:hypothetical protein
MFKKNMGRFDRTWRFIVGVALVPLGLFLLGGWQGRPAGLLVAGLALIPLATSLIGFCPLYVPFGISTREKKPAERPLPKAE